MQIRLRNDLELYPWEKANQNAEQWVIYDPTRNLFFRVSRWYIEVLKRIENGTVEEIAEQLTQETIFKTTPQQVIDVAKFLKKNLLILSPTPPAKATPKRSFSLFLEQLAKTYLFFRIPLVNPDRSLTAFLFMVRFLASRWFLWLTAAIGMTGSMLSLRVWDDVQQNVFALFQFGAVPAFVCALIVVKFLHELAHAFVAKAYGVQVPVMGIAFLLLFPMPYTDTSQSWKLKQRRHRRNIAAAGVLAELYLAAWATFLWHFSPTPLLEQILFIIATTTWISSVLLNVVPFMRFDGYFILSDSLGIENLHARSGAMGRWYLRRLLWGWDTHEPEEAPRKLKCFLIVFSYIVWVYRFFIFIAIALAVYHFVHPAIGIFLFCLEIYLLVCKPIMAETKTWWNNRRQFNTTKNTRITLLAIVTVCALVFFPFSTRTSVEGLYLAHQQATLFAPEDAVLQSLLVPDGVKVERGDAIMTLASQKLAYDYRVQTMQANRLSAAVQLSRLVETGQPGLKGREEKWKSTIELAKATQNRLFQLEIVSPTDGVMHVQKLHPGDSVKKGDILAQITRPYANSIVIYVDERLKSEVATSDVLTFYDTRVPWVTHQAKVTRVDEKPTQIPQYYALTRHGGGDLKTLSDGQTVKLADPLFKVELTATQKLNTNLDARVQLLIPGARKSLAKGVLERAIGLYYREFQ